MACFVLIPKISVCSVVFLTAWFVLLQLLELFFAIVPNIAVCFAVDSVAAFFR